MSRTSSGVALMSRLQMIELIDTLLPDPVWPAMRRCGSFARSATIGEPDTSRPSATVSFELASLNIAVSATSFRDRKSTRLNSSHEWISYAVFCLKKNVDRFRAHAHGRQ